MPHRRQAGAAGTARPRRSSTDPRIQARRVDVARQVGRRRRRRIIVGLVVAALVGGGFALVHSSVLGARHVTVTGAPKVPSSLVIQAAGLEDHPPLIDLDAATIARKVEELPWVATAAVDISWPSSVSIRLTQRIPVAEVKLATGGYAECDATGRVLADAASRDPTLPVIAADSAAAPGSMLAGSGPTLASVAAHLPESLVSQTVELGPSTEGIVVVLTDRIEAVIGSPDDLSQKFVSLATVLAHGSLSGVTVIDLRTAAAPVLIRQASGPKVAGNVGG